MSNILSLKYFLPELVLSATALLLLVYAFMAKAKGGKFACVISLAGLAAAFALVMQQNFSGKIFLDLLNVDGFSSFFKIIFLITAFLIVIFSRRSVELYNEGTKLIKDAPEYYSLILGMVVGMFMLASSTNILMIYLSLEFVSLMSYLLVGYRPNSERSHEAALKYVMFGAVASGVFLFGGSLYYGFTGTLNIAASALPAQGPVFIAGVLMLAGFLYKVAAVPMHAWCPDAYEGAPTPITAFLSVAPKVAGFAVLLRVASQIGVASEWPYVIAVVSAVTMTLGNLAAIPQNNLKRLLAYSSIAHAGYLLMGVSTFTQRGNEAVYFYIMAYLVMNLGAFLVVQIVVNEKGVETIDAYDGLGRRGAYGSVVAICMTIFLLSLTGVPPFIGFIGKFYLFWAVLDAKIYWLAFIGIANSLVSLYYYMRIVKAMFLSTAKNEGDLKCQSLSLTFIMVILAITTLVLGLAWGPLTTYLPSITR